MDISQILQKFEELRLLHSKATAGDWFPAGRWAEAYVFDQERLGINVRVGECLHCKRLGPPVVVKPVTDPGFNPNFTLVHVHRETDDYLSANSIENHDGTELVAGTWNYEDGGIRRQEDTDYIIALHNFFPELEKCMQLLAQHASQMSATKEPLP